MFRVMAAAVMSFVLVASSAALAGETQRPEGVRLLLAQEWKVGERVLAHWSGDDYWYPATVREVKDGQYYVVFDDGDKEWTDASRVGPEDLKAGDRVFGNWKQLGVYYPGKISTRKGEQIHITYDDGDEEDTTVAVVRVKRPRG